MKDKPGRSEDDREGQVHLDTAKQIDPSQYGQPAQDNQNNEDDD